MISHKTRPKTAGRITRIAGTILFVSITAITNMTTAATPETDALKPVTYPLWPNTPPGALDNVDTLEQVHDTRYRNVHTPELTLYEPQPDIDNGITVLIFPGGGYNHLSMKYEGSDVAERFRAAGFLAGVVKYRMAPYRHPIPLLDAARAFELTRRLAKEHGADPDRIGVLGFSAGGHLAATLSVLAGKPGVVPDGASIPESARPAFAVLIYPVISLDIAITNSGSRTALLGEQPAPELVTLLSADLHVDAESPPTFFVHCEDDHVSIRGSERMHQALIDAGVETRFLRFETGGHGFGLTPDDPALAAWPAASIDWIRSLYARPGQGEQLEKSQHE